MTRSRGRAREQGNGTIGALSLSCSCDLRNAKIIATNATTYRDAVQNDVLVLSICFNWKWLNKSVHAGPGQPNNRQKG